jgi:hypothetical protein
LTSASLALAAIALPLSFPPPRHLLHLQRPLYPCPCLLSCPCLSLCPPSPCLFPARRRLYSSHFRRLS